MGIYLAQVPTIEELLPPRGNSIYEAGLKDSEKGHIKYALPNSDNPNLLIVNPIYDNAGGIIIPGYYELALGYERTMLYLIQAGKEVASIPVFKVEEDKTETWEQEPRDKKSLKKYTKEKKKKEKEIKKLKKKGKIAEEPQIYSKATIEYDEDEDYYVIKYEKGKIRAFGAIKCH